MHSNTVVRKFVPGELISNRISDVVAVVESAVTRTIAALGNDPEQSGGYFRITCTTNNPDSRPLRLIPISFVPNQFASRFANFTLKETLRLRAHPECFSSHECRNQEQDEYGCAIRVWRSYIFAFSGLLPDHANEAAMVLVAHELDLVPSWQVRHIVQASGNELAIKLADLHL
jgi:hypothetical protein